jgi:glycine C-acetyltransferase
MTPLIELNQACQ